MPRGGHRKIFLLQKEEAAAIDIDISKTFLRILENHQARLYYLATLISKANIVKSSSGKTLNE